MYLRNSRVALSYPDKSIPSFSSMPHGSRQASVVATLLEALLPGVFVSSGEADLQFESRRDITAPRVKSNPTNSVHFERPDSKSSSKAVVGAVVDVPGHGAAEDDPEAPDWRRPTWR